MAVFDNPRREALAQALARGAAPAAAWREAGYSPHQGRAVAASRRDDMVPRVEEITRQRTWGGSADLAPVIDQCMALAVKSGDLGTGAGMAAARNLLVEAARLKGLLPKPVDPDYLRPELTEEEWMLKYGSAP